jgi:hypothetical protein
MSAFLQPLVEYLMHYWVCCVPRKSLWARSHILICGGNAVCVLRLLLLFPQYVPSQPLVRYYGGNTVVDATGAAATDLQSASQLSKDILTQYSNSTAASSPLRVLGLFASTCFACRTTQLCGTLSCALGVSGLLASVGVRGVPRNRRYVVCGCSRA